MRGLDYYTRTVFEVQADAGLGSQNAIGGGGRYDRLMEEYGGPPTPGLGFALGFERTLLAMEAAGAEGARATAGRGLRRARGCETSPTRVFALDRPRCETQAWPPSATTRRGR